MYGCGTGIARAAAGRGSGGVPRRAYSCALRSAARLCFNNPAARRAAASSKYKSARSSFNSYRSPGSLPGPARKAKVRADRSSSWMRHCRRRSRGLMLMPRVPSVNACSYSRDAARDQRHPLDSPADLTDCQQQRSRLRDELWPAPRRHPGSSVCTSCRFRRDTARCEGPRRFLPCRRRGPFSTRRACLRRLTMSIALAKQQSVPRKARRRRRRKRR